jgi:hypothetical protein
MNKINKNLVIFNKYLKNRNKLFFKQNKYPFLGKTKYFPPVSKEWKNSIYAFNISNIKNLPIFNININELIKNYFNLYLNPKNLKNRLKSFNKIYVSKAEIKHTNSKAILTIYLYNREKVSLLNKINKVNKINKIKIIKKIKKLLSFYPIKLSKNYQSLILDQTYKCKKSLKLIRKYKLKLNLNKYKFEEKLLYKLKNLIFKIFNKKVEFNIVNLKSIILNSDIMTKLLTQKLKNKNSNVLRIMNKILNKVVLANANNIIERGVYIKNVDLDLLENKFRDSRLKSILTQESFSRLLIKNYYNIISEENIEKNYTEIYKLIFNSINYKNLSGARLEVKGRLSKRNRADRALFKVRLKGGLKNIYSSYKRLSSVDFRGYAKANVEYSIYSSKRKIGAFAVKGWISGK